MPICYVFAIEEDIEMPNSVDRLVFLWGYWVICNLQCRVRKFDCACAHADVPSLVVRETDIVDKRRENLHWRLPGRHCIVLRNQVATQSSTPLRSPRFQTAPFEECSRSCTPVRHITYIAIIPGPVRHSAHLFHAKGAVAWKCSSRANVVTLL